MHCLPQAARPQPRPRRHHRKPCDARRRGNVLILSTVLIVLLAMIGASYLQMARTQRRSVQAMDTRHQDYEGSILRFIGGILAADGVNPSNMRFNQERYDFAWTNPDTTTANITRNRVETGDLDTTYLATIVQTGDVSVATDHSFGDGEDADDDAWLASNELDFTGAALWVHLTNLRGVYLDLTPANLINVGTVAEPIMLPMQYLTSTDTANSNAVYNCDSNVPLSVMSSYPDVFADADGDNIPDSRWTWAPLPTQLGRRYVMAVRIVDNSAMADLNTWNRMSDDAGDFTGVPVKDQPRWYWPGELNLATALSENTVANAYLDNLMIGRGITASSNVAEFASRYRNWIMASRSWNNIDGSVNAPKTWAEIGSLYERDPNQDGNPDPASDGVTTTGETYYTMSPSLEPFSRFDRDNEPEIRWRNGLNRSSDNLNEDAITDIENVSAADISTFWRQDGTVEATFGATPYSTEQSWFEQEPRKRFTLFSGSADYERLALNADDADTIASGISANLADHPGVTTDGTWTSAAEMANYIGAVIEDFRDEDSELTKAGTVYGMEYLPFVSEVYVQARYQTTTGAVDPGDGSGQIDWTLQDVEAAIEIVNPWPWPIEIPEGLKLKIGDQDWGDLRDFFTTASLPPYLDGNELVVLVRDDDGVGSIAPTYSGTNIAVDRDTYDWPTNAGAVDGQIEIMLEASAGDGDSVVYQTVDCFSPASTPSDIYPVGSGGLTAAQNELNGSSTGYKQYQHRGTGNGLAVLTVRGIDVQFNRRDGGSNVDPNHVDAGAVLPSGLQFNSHAKGASSPAGDLSGLPAGLDNRVTDSFSVGGAPSAGDEPYLIGNADVIFRAGDIMRMVFLGPSDTKTLAEVWTDAAKNLDPVTGTNIFRISRFMLDINDESPTISSIGVNVTEGGATYKVNHALWLLGKFSTLRPDKDGVDNDGNGENDDETEHLIPGRLNINTASPALLARALPLPNDGTKTALINAIIEAREGTARSNVTTRNGAARKGIAFLGELAAHPTGNWTDANVVDGRFADFNEYDPDLGPSTPGWNGWSGNTDGFSDDAEEIILPLSSLNQVASVRTDIVTAYVLVRAYPADDFSAAPVQQYRMVATFDRSVIHENRPLPRLISVAVFQQP